MNVMFLKGLVWREIGAVCSILTLLISSNNSFLSIVLSETHILCYVKLEGKHHLCTLSNL